MFTFLFPLWPCDRMWSFDETSLPHEKIARLSYEFLMQTFTLIIWGIFSMIDSFTVSTRSFTTPWDNNSIQVGSGQNTWVTHWDYLGVFSKQIIVQIILGSPKIIWTFLNLGKLGNLMTAPPPDLIGENLKVGKILIMEPPHKKI